MGKQSHKLSKTHEQICELSAQAICVKAGDTDLVSRASFTLKPGELVALLGPNGAGKTTLLSAALGLQTLQGGLATLNGVDTQSLSPIDRARTLSYLPQSRPLAWPSRVDDIVALGRFSHGAALGALKGEDADAVQQALSACDIAHLKHRKADTLSGGELARVHCARAFAARAPLLIADEPVAALDPRHQFRVMDLLKAYVETQGGTRNGVLVVLHDIALAAQYADRLIFMKAGAIVADGPPEQILSERRLADIFGIRATVTGRTVVVHGAS